MKGASLFFAGQFNTRQLGFRQLRRGTAIATDIENPYASNATEVAPVRRPRFLRIFIWGFALVVFLGIMIALLLPST